MSSLRIQILNNIVEAIETIKGVGDGYVRDVKLIRLPAQAPSVRPIAEVWTGKEEKQEDQGDGTFCRLEVAVNVHASTHGDVETDAAKFISSVEQAVMADKYRSGLALNTFAVENEISADDIKKPEYTVSMIFNVDYQHAIGNPDSK